MKGASITFVDFERGLPGTNRGITFWSLVYAARTFRVRPEPPLRQACARSGRGEIGWGKRRAGKETREDGWT